MPGRLTLRIDPPAGARVAGLVQRMSGRCAGLALALILTGCGNTAAPGSGPPNGAAAASATPASSAAASATAASAPAQGGPSAKPSAAADSGTMAAAKQEGRVTFYGAVNPTTQQTLAAAFKSRYGIDVDSVRLATSPLAQRYAGEAAAGKVVADVVQLGDPAFFDDAAKKGWLAQLDALAAVRDWPQGYHSATAVKFALSPYGVAYNNQLLKEADVPATWQALLDPKWKGKLLLIDPRNTPGIMAWAYLMRQTYGPEYLQKLAGQQFRLVASGVPGGQQIAAGSAFLMAPSPHADVLGPAKDGAPLADRGIEPATGQEQQVALSARSPHPNAGRLFLEFLLSMDAQAIMANDGYVPVLPGVPGARAVPKDYHSPQFAEAAASQNELLSLLGISS